MKTIVYASLFYLPLLSIYKIFGRHDNALSVNYFWLLTYTFLGIVFYKILGELKKSVYPKMYNRIILCMVIYWGIMAVLRIIVLVRSDLYEKIISSANAWTLGTLSIISMLICLTASIWRRT